MKNLPYKIHISLTAVIMIIISSCGSGRFSETRFAITKDSSIPVTIFVYAKTEPDWDSIFLSLNEHARLYDHRIEGSPIWTLNTYGRATLPEEVYDVLAGAIDIARISDGAFDPSILPLTRLWGFDNQPGIPPEPDIESAMNLVDYRKISMMENGLVCIPEGYGLDLGGIAKGALVDGIAHRLAAGGYENFLIEASGDIIVSGLKPGNRKWSIGIRHPRNSEKLAGELSVGIANGRIAVVTSGDYEQYFEKEGRRYHHIINPVTGYPAMDVISVTIIAPNSTLADGLSTAAFVLGKERGAALLEKGKDTEGFFIYIDDGKPVSLMTEGFSAYLMKKPEL